MTFKSIVARYFCFFFCTSWLLYDRLSLFVTVCVSASVTMCKNKEVVNNEVVCILIPSLLKQNQQCSRCWGPFVTGVGLPEYYGVGSLRHQRYIIHIIDDVQLMQFPPSSSASTSNRTAQSLVTRSSTQHPSANTQNSSTQPLKMTRCAHYYTHGCPRKTTPKDIYCFERKDSLCGHYLKGTLTWLARSLGF